MFPAAVLTIWVIGGPFIEAKIEVSYSSMLKCEMARPAPGAKITLLDGEYRITNSVCRPTKNTS